VVVSSNAVSRNCNGVSPGCATPHPLKPPKIVRTVQRRLIDFADTAGVAFLDTVTTPEPGSTAQRITSPDSSPRIAATASGTVERRDCDRLSDFTALDSKVLGTGSPLTLFSGRLRYYGLDVGLPIGNTHIPRRHVGQQRGQRMPSGNLPTDPEKRGRLIANREGWVQPGPEPRVFFVRDIASGKTKLVRGDSGSEVCSCGLQGSPCEHVWAARIKTGSSMVREAVLQFVVDDWDPAERGTAYRHGQEAEYEWFDPILQALLEPVAEPARSLGQPGAPRTPLREALFLAVKKSHSGLSLSRLRGLYTEDRSKGRLTEEWNYSLPARTLGRDDITPILLWAIRESAKPLAEFEDGGTIAIDSTGFVTSVFGAYYPQAHDVRPRREFLKVHVAVGTRTNVVADVAVTDHRGADSPQFVPLLRGAVQNGFRPTIVAADKAYLSRANLQAAVDMGVQPRIPFKENSVPASKGTRIWATLYHLAKVDPDGFADQYHQRSNVEATFSSLKRMLGESVFSKRPVARLNEALCKVLAYNIVTLIRHLVARGIDLTALFRGPSTPPPAVGSPPDGTTAGNGGCERFESLVKESPNPEG
jgi:hypothetical protein